MNHSTTHSKKRKTSVPRGIWRSASWKWRVLFFIIGIFLILNFLMISIWGWYGWRHRNEPTVVGATFISSYANYFGLEPQETLDAMINDLGVKHLRLVSYWDHAEHIKDNYDFSELDWQFKMAEENGAKVSLAIGLRQPRWPECHMPDWATNMPKAQWQAELEDYMRVVIARYKDSPALESYQLENEFFLKAFGLCIDHDRERLVREYDLVKSLDSEHPIIVSRSNNAVGWPVYDPTPDEYAVSVYKRVYDKTFSKKYFEYPFPSSFYGMLAGISEITKGRNLFIHELQAEAWGSKDIIELSIEEQNKTMDAQKLSERIDYGLQTGMKRVDLWGPEYWYWRKTKMNDDSLWEAAKASISKHQTAKSVCIASIDAPTKPNCYFEVQ